MNIGATVYHGIVRYAEAGERVTRVTLPEPLYLDLMTEPGVAQMLKTFKIEVEAANVNEPVFYVEKERRKR